MIRRMARRAMLGLALGVAGLASCRPAAPPFASLDRDLAPLREAFNADLGRTRVLMVVSPTCDVCLQGAIGVHAALLAREPDSQLRPFVVWVPKVRGQPTDIADAAAIVPDRRMQHFWDGKGLLMNAYQQVLGLSEDAWDVFLVYDPDTRWEGELPPSPRLWMHQLGTPQRPRVRGRYLDVPAFASEVRAILRTGPPATPPVANQ